MFIDVTRYGGLRILRLQVSAIAYLDACEGGTAIHLVGGETLRVNEDPEQLETRIDAAAVPAPAVPYVAPPVTSAAPEAPPPVKITKVGAKAR